jgi:methylated-DNA-protein-cysteine methyltransferase related protein
MSKSTRFFREQIYLLTQQIPLGKVATYGMLARLAGKPHAARVVGYFMKINPDAPHTPCHRVVSSDGGLRGYSALGGILKKKSMLMREGVIIKNNKVDLSISLWRR